MPEEGVIKLTCDNVPLRVGDTIEFTGTHEADFYRYTWVPRWWPFKWPAKSVFLGTAEVTMVNEEEE